MGAIVQAFRFQVDIEPSIYYFTVIFKFADTVDENTLIVSDIIVKET
jgi:hypothetical protein